MDEFKPLTDKEIKFVEAFLASGNSAKASREAGYKSRGSGHALLQKAEIKAAIEGAQKEVNKNFGRNLEDAQKQTEEQMERCLKAKDLSGYQKAMEHLHKLGGHLWQQVRAENANTGFQITFGAELLSDHASAMKWRRVLELAADAGLNSAEALIEFLDAIAKEKQKVIDVNSEPTNEDL